jgi:putative MATE family efflux protein
MLIGSTFQVLYSIINAVWVGQGLGTNSMAAITESMPLFFLIVAVAIGLTMAANILVAQAYGAKNWDHLKSVTQNSAVLTIGTSFVCVAVGFLFARPLLQAMGTPSSVLPLAVSYMRIFILGTPSVFGTFLAASLLRGVGDSKTPVYFQGSFLLLTAVLDPLLMFGWLHFPKMGLNGTAVAGIITQTCSCAAICMYLHRKRHMISMDIRHLKLDVGTIRLMYKIGFPSMIQQGLISVGMIVITSLVNSFGDKAAGAFGIAMRIDQLAFMPAMNLGVAASTIAGQNMGARLPHRVNEVFKWGIIIGCGITAMASLLAVSVPGILLRAFTRDIAVISIGTGYLRIVGLGYMFMAVMFVSNGVINGSGHTFFTMICTLVGLLGIRLPLAIYISRAMHRPEGIWYAILIGLAAGMLLSLAYYFSGRWKIPVVRKFGMPERKDEGEEAKEMPDLAL